MADHQITMDAFEALRQAQSLSARVHRLAIAAKVPRSALARCPVGDATFLRNGEEKCTAVAREAWGLHEQAKAVLAKAKTAYANCALQEVSEYAQKWDNWHVGYKDDTLKFVSELQGVLAEAERLVSALLDDSQSLDQLVEALVKEERVSSRALVVAMGYDPDD